MEKCPKCDSQFIQFDNFNEECYCLWKDCMHKWKQNLTRKYVENDYLRTTMNKKEIRINIEDEPKG